MAEKHVFQKEESRVAISRVCPPSTPSSLLICFLLSYILKTPFPLLFRHLFSPSSTEIHIALPPSQYHTAIDSICYLLDHKPHSPSLSYPN